MNLQYAFLQFSCSFTLSVSPRLSFSLHILLSLSFLHTKTFLTEGLLNFLSLETQYPRNIITHHQIFCEVVILWTLFCYRDFFSQNFAHGLVTSESTSGSVHFSSVAQSCPTVCNPMNCSTPGIPVHYQLQEFTQTHVH